MTVSSTSVSSLLQQLQQSMFTSLDKNADGVLSASEFSALGQNVPGSATSGAAGSTTSTSSVAATTLAAPAASYNSDIMASLLSLQDQSNALTNFDPSTAAANMVQGADTNSDGSLSQSEFEQAYQSLSGGQGSQGTQGTHHHHHHHHGGGGGGGGGVGDASSTQAADNAFTAADANGDGELSTDELSGLLAGRQQTAETGIAQYQAADQLMTSFMNSLTSAMSTSAATQATQAVTA